MACHCQKMPKCFEKPGRDWKVQIGPPKVSETGRKVRAASEAGPLGHVHARVHVRDFTWRDRHCQ